MTEEKLEMEFDPNTIEDLGIRMYSTLPPVIAELIANSYDADASIVEVFLNDTGTSKTISIRDNGHGMSYGDLKTKFLRIGRKRRKEGNTQKSESGERFVIGRKGLGKLSFFGIASKAKITTVRDGLENSFILDIDRILESASTKYQPEIVGQINTKTEKSACTLIELMSMTRKTPFNPNDLALSLSRSFEIFDEEGFDVYLIHNNDNEKKLKITNKLKYENLNKEIEWDFPNKAFPSVYEFASNIKGRIISLAQGETVPTEMRGIALFSRKKLVNKHDFYGAVASSTGYSYLTGWLAVDFIEDFSRDVISTNRQSLNWELEETEPLKDFLQSTIKKIHSEQRKFRKNAKEEKVKKATGVDFETWLMTLPAHERKLARKLIDSIMQNEGISDEKAAELAKFIKDSFQFEAFKELAHDIDATNIEQTDRIIELFKEWKIIEAREFHKIAKIRIETIEKFSEHIENNAREVPILHKFLKEFPWILDPRIMSFRDEVTYSSMLREKFPNESTEVDADKRIDFLCLNFTETYFIIELKRPHSVISDKQLSQCVDYVTFLESRLENEYGKNVCCYLVGGKIADSPSVQKKVEAFRNNRTVYFKPYSSLLEQAKSYHQEFIDRYEDIKLVS